MPNAEEIQSIQFRASAIFHSVRGLMRTAQAWKADGNAAQYQHLRDNAALFMRWRRGLINATKGE
jgi:hypothetical protein